jgi:hypothetical protein
MLHARKRPVRSRLPLLAGALVGHGDVVRLDRSSSSFRSPERLSSLAYLPVRPLHVQVAPPAL